MANSAVAAPPDYDLASPAATIVDSSAGQPAEVGTQATDEDLGQARGGIIWFYYAVVGTTAVLQTCSKVSCVQMGVTAFNSVSTARRFICQRKPRLRIC